MIVVLFFVDINFDEIFFILRYVDRVKQIKNSVFVNEDFIEKLIRELQEENEKLKVMLVFGNLEMVVGEEDDDLIDEGNLQMYFYFMDCMYFMELLEFDFSV